MEEEIKRLKAENIELNEKLENYIPRRRVRRIFKSLKAILEQDIQSTDKETAIEHIISNYEINSFNSNEN